MTPTPIQLAYEFCRVLSEWLTPDELSEINRLNADESDPHICHSGDYCDSNQALLDAMEVFGISGFEQWMIPLCNETWRIARDAGFNAHKLPLQSPVSEGSSPLTEAEGNRLAVAPASVDTVAFEEEHLG